MQQVQNQENAATAQAAGISAKDTEIGKLKAELERIRSKKATQVKKECRELTEERPMKLAQLKRAQA